MTKTLTRSSVVLALAAAGLAVATAAAAVLPDSASDVAREHTAEVTIPGPNVHSTGHGADTAAEAQDSAVEPTEAGEQGEHGAAVSELATSTELTGAEKGAAIAELASDGRSAARGESADHAAAAAADDGQAKAAEASAKGQEASASHRP